MMNWFLIKKRKKVKKINKKQTNFQPMTVCCLCVCEKERERERERERGVWKYSTCHSFHSVTCLAVGFFFFVFFCERWKELKVRLNTLMCQCSLLLWIDVRYAFILTVFGKTPTKCCMGVTEYRALFWEALCSLDRFRLNPGDLWNSRSILDSYTHECRWRHQMQRW